VCPIIVILMPCPGFIFVKITGEGLILYVSPDTTIIKAIFTIRIINNALNDLGSFSYFKPIKDYL
jgi:hypothetical protein